MTDPWTIRIAAPQDFDAVVRVFADALLVEMEPDAPTQAVFEPERTLIAESGDMVVGAVRVYTRDLSIPGAVVAAAHLTGVGVAATHRRRGVLSAMMRRQLSEVPEAITALWASEPGIYERYGFAPAGNRVTLAAELPRVAPAPVADTGRMREVSAAEAAEILAPILAGLQAIRPGVSGRSAKWWAKRLDDPKDRRHGATRRRILVHESFDGTPDGYALWRSVAKFSGTGACGEVRLEELVAVDHTAYHALWNRMLTVELATTLDFGFAATDDPLLQLAGNPRALGTRITDALWLRITNVAEALAQRRYATDVDVVLEVADPLLSANHGRFRLSAGDDGVSCSRTEAPADLSVSIDALSAAYLGSRSLAEFIATAKAVEHTAGALSATATAFGWPVAATSIEIF